MNNNLLGPKVIVALDFAEKEKALALVDELSPEQCGLKVGKEMFTRFGPVFVKELIKKNFKVFLDLKFHDIPNTVAKACLAAADLGVWMMNVHSLGGVPMMEAAAKELEPFGKDKPLLLAVTLLTSLSQEDINVLGFQNTIEDLVVKLALLSKQAGLDGVVSSPQEVKSLRAACGENFCLLTPGIRLSADLNDDQKRTLTPREAIDAGANFLVVGRPITQSENPLKILEKILVDINR